MALDFDAIKRKLERLSGNTTSRNVMWKPEEGQEYEVRLLSFPDIRCRPYRTFSRSSQNPSSLMSTVPISRAVP